MGRAHITESKQIFLTELERFVLAFCTNIRGCGQLEMALDVRKKIAIFDLHRFTWTIQIVIQVAKLYFCGHRASAERLGLAARCASN